MLHSNFHTSVTATGKIAYLVVPSFMSTTTYAPNLIQAWWLDLDISLPSDRRNSSGISMSDQPNGGQIPFTPVVQPQPEPQPEPRPEPDPRPRPAEDKTTDMNDIPGEHETIWRL
ncbi:hypothetical protein BFJ68_g16950 [Fusarium oxysporum]|uniref:Uncharacterized protein n=1 Tax=Fusarium oxysporum TaxID=5507 RepID=A0A420P6M5_FUSOX|nr:hypothetical protein BFJ68_g16950 [Fusarium oxysporum]